jgi:hypothetical protein
MRMSILALLIASSCAPATLDLVQPGAVSKDTFDGTWFWRRTVEEVPFGTAAVFVGAQTDLERIRWSVEEDLLLGYRAYENVSDSDAPTQVGPYFGAPLLAFPIEKHFDIRRRYNPTTGEESNVIEENVERPWFEREFFRVDWSTNQAESGWTFAGVDLPVIDFATTDPSDAAAPTFDDTDRDGRIDSIGLTQRVLAEPDSVHFPGFGDIPVCFFYGQAEYECAATEVGLFSSFVRVDERSPYEGLDYDDGWMETYGYFTTQRLTYDRAYGLLEPNRTFWANRHNLWEHSYARNGSGEVLCDSDAGRAPCGTLSRDDHPAPARLRFADREVKPIAYHVGPDFDPDLLDTLPRVAEAWNAPFADTVNDLRFWECIEEGGKKKDCTDLRDVDLLAFVICPHNPSRSGDPAVCSTDHTGPVGRPDGVPDVARVGDLRYSFVHLVDNPAISSPFGYGPSAADPVGTELTLADGSMMRLGAGQIISGNAFIYDYVLDRIATSTADLVDLLNGELDPESFIEGENVEAWVDAVNAGETEALLGGRADEPAPAEQLARMHNGFSPLLQLELGGVQVPQSPAEVSQTLDYLGEALGRTSVFGGGAAEAQANWERLLASGWDEQMWTDETLGAYGYDPSQSAPADGSPLDLVDRALMAESEYGRVLAGQHAVDLDEGAYNDPSLLGLARHYQKKGMSREQIVADVRAETFVGVLLHEIGHTLGLRHNFAGSFDAWNFQPTYWELRDDGHMAPRHVDPETNDEIDGRIREFQYSSVMDYGGSINADWHGLGHHDEAAVKFGYGQLVEVHTEVDPAHEAIPGLPDDVGVAYAHIYNGASIFPAPLVSYTSGAVAELHYTDYPAIAGDLEARTNVPLSRLVPSIGLEDETGFAKAYVVGEGLGGVVQAGDPSVPYRFCSDERATGLLCARWDEGADPFEVQAHLMSKYTNGYLLNNFQRGRYGFGSSAGYVNRLFGRTFDPLATWQRYYALLHGVFDAQGDPQMAVYFAADKGFGPWTAATDESFQFLANIILRPEPGAHEPTHRADGVELAMPVYGEGSEEIELVEGAFYESEWDYDSGYHWFDRKARIGTYWDRMLALLTLTDTSSYNFFGYDTAVDPRRYALGYQDLYGDAIALLLGQLTADDVAAFAPVRGEDGNLQYPDVADLDRTWPPEGHSGQIQPATHWMVRFDAGLFGKALLNRGYDRSFLNRSRIYVEGTGEAPMPPKDAEVVRWTDPASGKTYAAWSFAAEHSDGEVRFTAEGEPIELGSGAMMIGAARALGDLCSLEVTAPYTNPESDASLEAQRTLACDALDRYVVELELQLQMFRTFDSVQ